MEPVGHEAAPPICVPHPLRPGSEHSISGAFIRGLPREDQWQQELLYKKQKGPFLQGKAAPPSSLRSVHTAEQVHLHVNLSILSPSRSGLPGQGTPVRQPALCAAGPEVRTSLEIQEA